MTTKKNQNKNKTKQNNKTPKKTNSKPKGLKIRGIAFFSIFYIYMKIIHASC